jgi:hypothetical protein
VALVVVVIVVVVAVVVVMVVVTIVVDIFTKWIEILKQILLCGSEICELWL